MFQGQDFIQLNPVIKNRMDQAQNILDNFFVKLLISEGIEHKECQSLNESLEEDDIEASTETYKVEFEHQMEEIQVEPSEDLQNLQVELEVRENRLGSNEAECRNIFMSCQSPNSYMTLGEKYDLYLVHEFQKCFQKASSLDETSYIDLVYVKEIDSFFYYISRLKAIFIKENNQRPEKEWYKTGSSTKDGKILRVGLRGRALFLKTSLDFIECIKIKSDLDTSSGDVIILNPSLGNDKIRDFGIFGKGGKHLIILSEKGQLVLSIFSTWESKILDKRTIKEKEGWCLAVKSETNYVLVGFKKGVLKVFQLKGEKLIERRTLLLSDYSIISLHLTMTIRKNLVFSVVAMTEELVFVKTISFCQRSNVIEDIERLTISLPKEASNIGKLSQYKNSIFTATKNKLLLEIQYKIKKKKSIID